MNIGPVLAQGFVWRGYHNRQDFGIGDLTSNDTWNELDLSSIVPAGATAILMHIKLMTGTPGALCKLRRAGGNVIYYNCHRPQVADLFYGGYIPCPISPDRKIDYNISATMTACYFTVKGWWL